MSSFRWLGTRTRHFLLGRVPDADLSDLVLNKDSEWELGFESSGRGARLHLCRLPDYAVEYLGSGLHEGALSAHLAAERVAKSIYDCSGARVYVNNLSFRDAFGESYLSSFGGPRVSHLLP